MKKLNFKYLLFSMLTVLAVSATAQKNFTLNLKESKLTVAGTSSIHDWEMDAKKFSAQTKLELNENRVAEIQSIDFACKVDDIESGKRIMDNKAYDALNEKRYPEISFQLHPDNQVKVSGEKVSLTGDMTIAGKKRKVNVDCTFDVKNSNQFSVSGEVPLKMSEFGIEPPTAMLGTLETGDEVVVKFDFQFTKGSGALSDL